jgi:hypothetical protein
VPEATHGDQAASARNPLVASDDLQGAASLAALARAANNEIIEAHGSIANVAPTMNFAQPSTISIPFLLNTPELGHPTPAPTPKRRRAPAKPRGKSSTARAPRGSARGRKAAAPPRKVMIENVSDEEDQRGRKRTRGDQLLEDATDKEEEPVPKKRTCTRRIKKEEDSTTSEHQWPLSLLYFMPPERMRLFSIPICTSTIPEIQVHLSPLLKIAPAYEIVSASLDAFGMPGDKVELLELILSEASWTAAQALKCFVGAFGVQSEDQEMFFEIAQKITTDKAKVDGLLGGLSGDLSS